MWTRGKIVDTVGSLKKKMKKVEMASLFVTLRLIWNRTTADHWKSTVVGSSILEPERWLFGIPEPGPDQREEDSAREAIFPHTAFCCDSGSRSSLWRGRSGPNSKSTDILWGTRGCCSSGEPHILDEEIRIQPRLFGILDWADCWFSGEQEDWQTLWFCQQSSEEHSRRSQHFPEKIGGWRGSR